MKHASRLLSLLVLTVAFVLLTGSSCDKGTPDREWETGAFQPVDKNIKDYTLPAGITIDSLYGELDSVIPESDMPLRMQVSNTNSASTQVTFPTGLVFDPGNAVIKYMMLVKDFTFTANAGVTAGILVPTYYCNEDLDDPDDESFYTIAGIEWDKETEELFNLVANKALNTDDAILIVQDALTEITDGGGLTDASRAAINALP